MSKQQQRRYEVVLDGIDVSDEEHSKLESSIQGVVRDFLESKQRAGSLEEGRLQIVDEPSRLRKLITELPNGHTAGIWAGPQDFLERS
jgi:hypothetical protein